MEPLGHIVFERHVYAAPEQLLVQVGSDAVQHTLVERSQAVVLPHAIVPVAPPPLPPPPPLLQACISSTKRTQETEGRHMV